MRFFNQEVKTHTGAYLSLLCRLALMDRSTYAAAKQATTCPVQELPQHHQIFSLSLSLWLLIYIASSAEDERCELWMEASKENTRG